MVFLPWKCFVSDTSSLVHPIVLLLDMLVLGLPLHRHSPGWLDFYPNFSCHLCACEHIPLSRVQDPSWQQDILCPTPNTTHPRWKSLSSTSNFTPLCHSLICHFPALLLIPWFSYVFMILTFFSKPILLLFPNDGLTQNSHKIIFPRCAFF